MPGRNAYDMLCDKKPLPRTSTPSSRSGANALPSSKSSPGVEAGHRHLEHGHVDIRVHRHERHVRPVIQSALGVVGAGDVFRREGAHGPARRGRAHPGTSSGSTARGTRRSRRRAAPCESHRASSVVASQCAEIMRMLDGRGIAFAHAASSVVHADRRAAPAHRAPRRSPASASASLPRSLAPAPFQGYFGWALTNSTSREIATSSPTANPPPPSTSFQDAPGIHCG